MKYIFAFIEKLFGSSWRPSDYSPEFRRDAARDGYLLARTKWLLRRVAK